MKKCGICEKEIGKFKKTYDGYICEECLKGIPAIFVKNLKLYSCSELDDFIHYFKGFKRAKRFNATLKVKNIAIDEIEGLIRIGNKKNGCIFDLTNVKSEAFTIDYKFRKGKNAVCDIYFGITFDEPKVRFDRIRVGRHISPIEEGIDSITVGLPYSIQFFENALISCNHRKIEEYNYNLEHGKSSNLEEFVKAKGLFLIKDKYDLDYIKDYRNKMIKMLHPDNNPNGEIPELITAINNAYYILKKELE